MQITKIVIDKFRKLENITENNIGTINELYGSNGSGKTSFISFISWMIYGETLDYGKNDDMNIDSFNPEEYISGSIYFSNGTDEYNIKRVYGYNEKGNKKNDFYVNDRKVSSQRDYYQFINKIYGIDKLDVKIKDFNLVRALSDPYYLPNKENQFRDFINQLLNIDIYKTLFENEKYKPLEEDFNFQGNYDNIKDYYRQTNKKNESMLNMVNSLIKTYSDNSKGYNKADYEKLENELNEKKNLSYKKNDELIKYENELKELEQKINESKKNDLTNKTISQEEKELQELKEKYNTLLAEYNDYQIKNSNAKVDLFKINNLISAIDDEMDNVNKQKFTKIYCPNCNTLINDKDFKSFNKEHTERIKELSLKKEKLFDKKKTIVIKPLDEMEKQLSALKDSYKTLQDTFNQKPINYTSDETKALITQYNALCDKYNNLKADDDNKCGEFYNNLNAEIQEIEKQLFELRKAKDNYDVLQDKKEEKEILLDRISTIELKLSLLKEFKEDEIRILENATSKIFGDDFKFTMLVENKTTDSFKNVCYANIDGLEHNRNNTAKYLNISILMLEKIKQFINPNCDIPIIFDIADNIGKKTRELIFNEIKKSQIFYTRIADDENVERELKVIK